MDKKINEKYVESVNEEPDGKASIVIERLNTKFPELNEKQIRNENILCKQVELAQHKNYYEVELSHSQSDILIRKK